MNPLFGLRGCLERPDMMRQSVRADDFYEHLVGVRLRRVQCCNPHGPQPVPGQYQREQLDFKGLIDAEKYAIGGRSARSTRALISSLTIHSLYQDLAKTKLIFQD